MEPQQEKQEKPETKVNNRRKQTTLLGLKMSLLRPGIISHCPIPIQLSIPLFRLWIQKTI